MKISELIKYATELMNKYGDHEITKLITGGHDQNKPINISLELSKSSWIKKRTVTDNEKITIERRVPLYKLRIDEDLSVDENLSVEQ